MFEIHPISFNKNKIYENKVRYVCYTCLLLITIFFLAWYVLYSEPYKIYRNDKIDVVQYLL